MAFHRSFHLSWPGLTRPFTLYGLKSLGSLLAVFMAAVSPAVAAECLPLNVPVTLAGRVMELTFPGPPNYQSIQKGDRQETYWFLRLDEPLCIKADGTREDDLGQDVRRIKIVQLLVMPESFGNYLKLVGQRASIAGQFFGAETGHHRTAVLLEQPKLQQILQ